MDPADEYLLQFLNDEFRDHPDVRIRVTPVEREQGVQVRTETREYFFPFEWSRAGRRATIVAEIQRIKEGLGVLA